MDLDLDFFGQDLGFFAGLGFEIGKYWIWIWIYRFFDNFANMYGNVEMTHEPNSSFEFYAVIIHFFRL